MLSLQQKLLLTILLIIPVSIFGQDEFFEPKSTIGGYGELHYNLSKKEGQDATKTLDFHRFIIFYSHSWTEKWSFKSEVELEHNFVKEGQGELELEQAYVNYHHSDHFGFQAGVVLPSVGFLNEYHEPPLFLSVERPEYSKNIIPTTWFGNGIAIYGANNQFNYKAVILEGLDGSKFKNSSGIRSGRQKGFKANAENFLYNARIDYTGTPGLRAGFSYSYNNAYVSPSINNAVNITEFHAKYEANNIYSVFEVGNISYDTGDLESSFGYYFDLGYNIGSFFPNTQAKIIPWFRWTDYNGASTTKTGGDSEKANHISKWLIGLSIKPIKDVIFKIEYGISTKELGDAETKVFNLGTGYMF